MFIKRDEDDIIRVERDRAEAFASWYGDAVGRSIDSIMKELYPKWDSECKEEELAIDIYVLARAVDHYVSIGDERMEDVFDMLNLSWVERGDLEVAMWRIDDCR